MLSCWLLLSVCFHIAALIMNYRNKRVSLIFSWYINKKVRYIHCNISGDSHEILVSRWQTWFSYKHTNQHVYQLLQSVYHNEIKMVDLIACFAKNKRNICKGLAKLSDQIYNVYVCLFTNIIFILRDSFTLCIKSVLILQ